MAREELEGHQARRAIPTTIIAFDGPRLVGSASLLAEDMPDFPPIGPWLASVFVTPGHRGRGIGTLLVTRVLEEARQLGVSTVHLFTTEAAAYYLRRGWRIREPRVVQGQPGVIMSYDLDPE
ncbi:MAG: GNAT family N-acetyltransferase [Gemmatimonadota bacterium]|nr:GNAT family N-acetyltransferase [Gemmatimonadota bacterium]